MENEQAKKNFLIKVGVISAMFLIVIFWLLNAKNIFVFNVLEEPEENEISKLDNIKDDLLKKINKIEEDLAKIKENENFKRDSDEDFLRSVMAGVDKSSSSSAAHEESENTPNIETNLNNNVIIDESPVLWPMPRVYPDSSSSPGSNPDTGRPGQVTNNSCPAYVNCMPTTDRTPSCQIPSGCEGITQLVY